MNVKSLGVWDVHHHWVNEPDYIETLLREMDRIGIERVFLIAMDEQGRDLFRKHEYSGFASNNEDLARIVKQWPDRIAGYGYIQLGRHESGAVDRIKELGLQGLKFHQCLRPYGEEEYFDVYARALELRLPCLFHTGVINMGKPLPGMQIRSENYRPIHLEPIAQEFPNLRMIAAHLGVCWNREACALARLFPNIYVDLSANLGGWRDGIAIQTFKEFFYWPNAHKKILFGSDLHVEDVEATLLDQIAIFRQMDWSNEQIADILRNNAMEFFDQVEF
jgi:predicted TIM-barrel fold metal-dependent hydrolase